MFSTLIITVLFCYFQSVFCLELASDTILVTTETLFAVPHEGNVIRFQCSDENEAASWILPNEDEILLLSSEMNKTHVIYENKFNATKNYLDILGIKNGMDGQYICVLADSSKRVFFIPHIVSKARLTNSIMISLSVTGIFCLICLIVLLVDRYCFSDSSTVKAQIVSKSIRKKNVSSSTIAKLEFPA